MPQMYPMNWLFLFMFFTLIYITMIIMCYFSKKNFLKKIINFKKIKKINLIWKW
uniref:ATP synthase F0 subunit 8 n=1 Tax=Neodiprion sertifer TaxID=441937 RepID=A0A6B9TZ17_9HYME|nr:ATP synthase F0 subunit 8 [Neodiprion sertifer]